MSFNALEIFEVIESICAWVMTCFAWLSGPEANEVAFTLLPCNINTEIFGTWSNFKALVNLLHFLGSLYLNYYRLLNFPQAEKR